MNISNASATKPQWLPIYNSMWARGQTESIVTRDGVEILYDRLLSSLELDNSPDTTESTKVTFVHQIVPLESELEEYEDHLLEEQLTLARSSRSSTTYCRVLKKRLLVLDRILCALAAKYKDKAVTTGLPKSDSDTQLDLAVSRSDIEQHKTGSGVLVEIAVHSGLSLLFALLRQNWSHETLGGPPIYHDVLMNAKIIIKSLPPLMLGNDKNQLGRLAVESLNKVAKFLKEMTCPNSGTDITGQLLAAELLLHLALQRGSLCYLLEWIEMAVEYSKQGGMISTEEFCSLLRQMHITSGESIHRLSQYGAMMPLYKAAMIIMSYIASNTENEVAASVGSPRYPPEKCEVYVWGNNSCNQLGKENKENVLIAELAPSFQNVQSVEAGLYCTFLINTNGEVSACGKGSYGRLGLGSSNNQDKPKRLVFDTKIKKLSTSKGSDGHSFALSIDGQLYSWGDGDHGKLGHGISDTIKQPQMISFFKNNIIVCVSAGYRHSAAVTSQGELYTWGEGRHGRLGHEDFWVDYLKHPVKVQDVGIVSSVSCGFSHTLVLSADGKKVWSFGGGEFGKLGHGNFDLVCKPKEIEALQGMCISKVAAGGNFSVALSSNGQVYAWGVSECVGLSKSGESIKIPQLIEDLISYRIVDISVGDGHTLALTHDYQVFAWGYNTKGQCGQGRISSHLLSPKRVIGLDGVKICQISAGTSHSIAWTAPPSDRPLIIDNQPFTIDLQESTFAILHTLLEKYCDSFDPAKVPPPFTSSKDHEKFVLYCLQLLYTHLGLESSPGFVLKEQATPLKQLLFKLVDLPTPASIQAKVGDCLAVGISVLLPTIPERLQLLHSLLTQGTEFSKSQGMLLGIVGTSLKEHIQHSVFTGFDDSSTKEGRDFDLLEPLIKTILHHLHLNTMECLTVVESKLERNEEHIWQTSQTVDNLVYELHSSLLMHLLSSVVNSGDPKTKIKLPNNEVMNLIRRHVVKLLKKSEEVFSKCTSILTAYPDASHRIHGIVFDSPCAALLLNVTHTLLLLPAKCFLPLVPSLLSVVSHMDNLIQLVPVPVESSSETITPTNDATITDHWLWLIDLERTVNLLVGCCLNSMLVGPDLTAAEKDTSHWLENSLLSNGMEQLHEDFNVDVIKSCASCCIYFSVTPNNDFLKRLAAEVPNSVKMTLDMCATATQQTLMKGCADGERRILVFQELSEYAAVNLWSYCSSSVHCITSYVFLATLVKHCGIDIKTAHEYDMTALFDTVRLLQKYLPLTAVPDEVINNLEPLNTTYCNVLERCIFLLLLQSRVDALCNNKSTEMETSLSWNEPENESSLQDNKKSDSTLKCVCSAVLQFVTNNSIIPQTETTDVDIEDFTGWNVEPSLLYASMRSQQSRAEDRLTALRKILELLKMKNLCKDLHSKERKSSHLLSCFYEQLVCSCFGLCEEVRVSHVSHYLDNIESVSVELKQLISNTVHEIYCILVESLNVGCNADDESQEQLLAVTVFALSTRHEPKDIEHAVLCGLLSVLGSCIISRNMAEQNSLLTNALLQLLQIILLSTMKHSDKLDASVIENVICALHFHLQAIVQSLKSELKHNEYNISVYTTSEVRTLENNLAELVAFIHFLNYNETLSRMFASQVWMNSLLELVGVQRGSEGLPMIESLSTRLQCLELVGAILPGQDVVGKEDKNQLIKILMSQLAMCMWDVPRCEAERQALICEVELDRESELLTSPDATYRSELSDDSIAILDAVFDPDKCLAKSCSIQGGSTVIHNSPGGRGYALGSTAMVSGCYQWKFLIVNEHKGNEGTCIGVSKWPVKDYNHRSTSDMWLYRAYSGHIYHGAEHSLDLPSFTQGDYITVILDLDTKSLSFGKNGEEPKIAFQDMDITGPLYPCVVFYSTKPGEKVKLTDMQLVSTPRELLAGDPQCAPSPVVLAETYIRIIRNLHESPFWSKEVNECLMERLHLAKVLLSESIEQTAPQSDNTAETMQSCDKGVTQTYVDVSDDNKKSLKK